MDKILSELEKQRRAENIYNSRRSMNYYQEQDTVKKNKSVGYEMVEEMIDAYASVLGQVDVVKYIHHGYKRNAAAAAMMSFDPRYVVVTAEIATGNDVIRERYPDSDVKLINCGLQTYVFESDGENLSVTPKE